MNGIQVVYPTAAKVFRGLVPTSDRKVVLALPLGISEFSDGHIDYWLHPSPPSVPAWRG
jgi:hypothetical protein